MTWFGIYLPFVLAVSLGTYISSRVLAHGKPKRAGAVGSSVLAGLAWPVVLIGVLQIALVAGAARAMNSSARVSTTITGE